MSRIKGLNDKKTIYKKQIKPSIFVWKGAKKTPKSAGKSLGNKFRIEAPNHLKAIIKKAYNANEDNNGSLHVEALNIVPAYDDEFKTFDSKMSVYNASRPILFCDRETIHTKYIQDEEGYFAPHETKDPCPVANSNHQCPNGCRREGNFYFYIWELIEAGFAEFARLQVGSIDDNQSIAQVLDDVKAEIGSIKTSPFVNERSRGYIVYLLNRRAIKNKFPIMDGDKRSAKRGTKEDWIVNLALHPLWKNPYDHHQQLLQLQAANYQPSTKLIEQVYGEIVEEAPQLSGSATPALPPSWSMTKERALELKSLRITEGWADNVYEEYLFETFEIRDRSEILNISESQFLTIKSDLRSLQVKSAYKIIS